MPKEEAGRDWKMNPGDWTSPYFTHPPRRLTTSLYRLVLNISRTHSAGGINPPY